MVKKDQNGGGFTVKKPRKIGTFTLEALLRGGGPGKPRMAKENEKQPKLVVCKRVDPAAFSLSCGCVHELLRRGLVL